MAGDVGWGHWQQKSSSIAKWVERAETFSQDLVQHEQAEEDLLLRVDRAALAALAGVSEPPDVSQRTKNCLHRASQLIEKSADTARAAEIQWQLGLALSEAVAIEQARGRYDKGFDYGRQALAHLEAGDPAGRHSPNHDFLLGRLLYRIGVSAAIGEHDHALAIDWYDARREAARVTGARLAPVRSGPAWRNIRQHGGVRIGNWTSATKHSD